MIDFPEFKKLINDFKFPINNEEAKFIFSILNEQNIGLVNIDLIF
jgi:hypothetical protein